MQQKSPKKWIFGCCVVVVLAIFSMNSTNVTGSTTSHFKGENAYKQASYLVTEIGPRPTGSDAELKAGDYIASTLQKYGWQVKIQNFSKAALVDRGSLKKYSLINSRNIIAVLPGRSKHSVIIGAHYDSADFNVSGANDNASGVGVLLEAARVLGQEKRESTYVLVAFGAEEAGLVGSRYFADNYDLSQVSLMINLDMVGEGNRVALDGGGKVSTPPHLLQTAFQLAKQQGLVPEVKRDLMLLARDSRDGGTSDFSPFLDKGVPAIGLGHGGKTPSYYHQPTDTVEHLNEATLTKLGSFTLELVNWGDRQPVPVSWNDLYLTLDLRFILLTISAPVIKMFVISSILFALIALIAKHRRQWISLVWLVPGLFLPVFAVILISSAPELILGKLKGSLEPWYTYPMVYVLIRMLTVALILTVLTKVVHSLPSKFLPRSGDVYWAGSVILLMTGTAILAANRWDVAFYLAFWLLFTTLALRRFPLVMALLAPLPIYGFHWQLLNSHIGTEFYRVFSAHFIIFAAVYALGLLPTLLAVAAWLADKKDWQSTKAAAWLTGALVLCSTAAIFLPVYTTQNPQPVNIRQEWQEGQLGLQATSADWLPKTLSRSLGAGAGSKDLKVSLKGGIQPPQPAIKANVVNLNSERLVTVDVQLTPGIKPYVVKIKLRAEEPFTLVNGGDFFPLGKLVNKVKLTGEPTSGIYGLILERTPPQPEHFQIYLKAKGPVRFTVETQYPGQFIVQKFQAPRTVIKYENWSTVVKEI